MALGQDDVLAAHPSIKHPAPAVLLRIHVINAELRRRCDAAPQAAFVDCPVAYERGPLWERDGLHFSPAGSAALGVGPFAA